MTANKFDCCNKQELTDQKNNNNDKSIDVTIVGNGPGGMFLSYILQGNIPYYDPNTINGPHPDKALHQLLLKYSTGEESLLDAVTDQQVIDYISNGGYSSFFSSTMLPIDLLIDTLISSDETEFSSNLSAKKTRISWKGNQPPISHLVIGNTSKAGGQWANLNETDGPDDKSLSYAEMLSLPGYSYTQYLQDYHETPLNDYCRPNRKDVSEYYSIYPSKVGIESNFVFNSTVTCIDKKDPNAFVVTYYDQTTKSIKSLTSKSIVLASGVSERPTTVNNSASPSSSTKFSELAKIISSSPGKNNKQFLDTHTIVPPLSTPPCEDPCTHGPCSTLIIGSGVSAAEAINKCQKGSSIIHIFKWEPKKNPSPLRRYPKELYPDYSSIYNLMLRTLRERRDDNTTATTYQYDDNKDYEGLINAKVIDISPDGMVDIELEDGEVVCRRVSKIKLRTGRSGSLDYISPQILNVNNDDDNEDLSHVTKNTVRETLHANYGDLKINDGVYAVGSLSGDTLVRFLLGGCMVVAKQLI